MVDVNSENFQDWYHLIRQQIFDATFIAVDTEFSSLRSNDKQPQQ